MAACAFSKHVTKPIDVFYVVTKGWTLLELKMYTFSHMAGGIIAVEFAASVDIKTTFRADKSHNYTALGWLGSTRASPAACQVNLAKLIRAKGERRQ